MCGFVFVGLVALSISFVSAQEAPQCSSLTSELKDKVEQLMTDGETTVFNEGDIIKYQNYVVVGDNTGAQLVKLIRAKNTSESENGVTLYDNVTFFDELTGEKYETEWIVDGDGTISIGGVNYGVTLQGHGGLNIGDYEVTLGGTVDYISCFEMCSAIPSDVKNEAIELVNAGNIVILKEKEIMHDQDYVVVGDNAGAQLVKLTRARNTTESENGVTLYDMVRFENVLTGEKYEAEWIVDGDGTISIGGVSFDVTLFGSGGLNAGDYEVTLDYPGSIDYSSCLDVVSIPDEPSEPEEEVVEDDVDDGVVDDIDDGVVDDVDEGTEETVIRRLLCRILTEMMVFGSQL